MKKRAVLDTDEVKRALSHLLGIEIQCIISRGQTLGYDGNVHRICIYDVNDIIYDFILKGMDDPYSFSFYQDILKPFNLNSPTMYGIIRMDDNSFMVMDYIHHQPLDLERRQYYEHAIDWLVKKDIIVNCNLEEVRSCTSVYKSFLGANIWVEILRHGVEVKVHPILTAQWCDDVEDQMAWWIRVLDEGRQTLRHNDFQLQNILIGAGNRVGAMYVIDWTYPNIGSVCVDLATLLHTAPASMRGPLVNRYRSHIDFDGFGKILRSAQACVNLSVLAWAIEAILNGQGDVAHRTYCEALIKELTRSCTESGRPA